jgi:hypothetical protein
MHILLMVLHREWSLHEIDDRVYSICHNWCQDEHVQDICIWNQPHNLIYDAFSIKMITQQQMGGDCDQLLVKDVESSKHGLPWPLYS